MKQLFVGFALVAVLAAVGGELQAQTKVTYRDATKKDKPVVEASGTMKSESPSQVVLKPNIGNDRTIPAGDVIDIFYEVKPDIRAEYRKAHTAETVTAPKAPAGSPARKAALNEALSEYQKLLPKVAGIQFVERHIKYKIASLSAQLAADDKAMHKQAVDLLEKFKKENADGWQILGCIRSLSQLHLDAGDYAKAAGTFDDLKKLPGISDETKTDCDLSAADCLVRAKKHAEAGERLAKILATMPKNNPRYNELNMKRILCDANTPAKFNAAIADLRKMAAAAKDPTEIATAYNTLGDCYLMNNQPKDAVYEYLWVDVHYNQDKTQHLKAVQQLAQVFKELKQPDRAKEYAEKLEKMNKP
jgi:tetratricopeptide (TPR) repeat protein